MYALKRIVAYVIDVVVLAVPTALFVEFAEGQIAGLFPERMHGLMGISGWVVSASVPVLILGTLSGLTGRTPGKFVTSLKVQDHAGEPPGLAQGIVREVIKAVSLGFFFGMIWALQAVVTGQRTFYDQWLDLDVEDLRPSGLTPTQKNFRKYMREQAKKRRS